MKVLSRQVVCINEYLKSHADKMTIALSSSRAVRLRDRPALEKLYVADYMMKTVLLLISAPVSRRRIPLRIS